LTVPGGPCQAVPSLGGFLLTCRFLAFEQKSQIARLPTNSPTAPNNLNANPLMNEETLQEIQQVYGVENWSSG
jgi:hypothetical protein